MYARSTTIEAQPERIDAGIAHLRDEVLPAVHALDGCIGMSAMVCRDTGRCIITTAWETDEAMQASAGKARQLRGLAAEKLGGEIEKVEEWEIAVLHRDHNSGDGACARATWVTGDPARFVQNIEYYKTSLPDIENVDGFCSGSLLINRATGRAVVTTAFDSHEAMERNRDEAAALKTAKMRELPGVEELDECEFELALAHLRVPHLV